MPRVNIYIRDEDFESWQKIPSKPKFIHEAINGTFGTMAILGQFEMNKIAKEHKLDPLSVVQDTLGLEVCEHVAGKGFCKVRKCKYSMFNPKNK